MPQSRQSLARAGFIYLNRGDHVQCFFCNGALKNWDQEDKAWIEHARWYSACKYLIHNVGREFIRRVQSGDVRDVVEMISEDGEYLGVVDEPVGAERKLTPAKVMKCVVNFRVLLC